jgi:hypothetical protein
MPENENACTQCVLPEQATSGGHLSRASGLAVSPAALYIETEIFPQTFRHDAYTLRDYEGEPAVPLSSISITVFSPVPSAAILIPTASLSPDVSCGPINGPTSSVMT